MQRLRCNRKVTSSKGALEAEIANAIVKFQREQHGRGPQDVRAHLVGDLILVRCLGIWTPIEVKLCASDKGRRLVKSARQELRAIVHLEIEEVVGGVAVSDAKVVPNADEADKLLDARPNTPDGQTGRGRHKIYLGFAAGVGKTYKMLEEANRRRERGQNVVVGYLETHKRAGTEAQIGHLEFVPRQNVAYRGVTLPEMDADAILARRPQIVLVDELAHSNVPGSQRQKRWQDVEMLLDAGINVLSTLNVQHLESLNNAVFDITGVRVRETLPDRVLRDADEIVIVDITPRSLVNRLKRGDIYAPEKIEQAASNWFREGNLGALREIALREVAREVDSDVSA